MSSLYAGNRLAADERYLGQAFVIEGVVQLVDRDADGEPHVVLSGAYEGKPVILMFSKDQQSMLVPLRRSLLASFRCIGMGDQGSFLLANCRSASQSGAGR